MARGTGSYVGRGSGLGPSSNAAGPMPGAGMGSAVAPSGFGTAEGRALLVLVFVELLLTGWLRVIFKGTHGG